MQAGHTQHEASLICCRDLRTWQRWENGDSPVPPEMLQLYAIIALAKDPKESK